MKLTQIVRSDNHRRYFVEWDNASVYIDIDDQGNGIDSSFEVGSESFNKLLKFVDSTTEMTKIKQKEFIKWVNESGFDLVLNVIDKDNKGDFLDVTANKLFELFELHLNEETTTEGILLKIKELKSKLLIEKERVKFEEAYKKLNPFNWQSDLSKRDDGSYGGEIAFYAFKYWLIRAEIDNLSKLL